MPLSDNSFATRPANKMKSKRTALAVVAAASTALTVNLFATEALDTTRSTVKEWVATEKAISTEAIAWQEKQALLNDLIAVTRVETETLFESIGEIQSNATVADSVRTGLLDAQESHAQGTVTILQFLTEIEPKLITLKRELPAPLVDKLDPFYQRIPIKGEDHRLSPAERMQTVAGILTAVQQFDQTITVSQEIRMLGDDTKGEVQTLYIGLGAGYYRTRSGDDAGTGIPGPTGWIWQTRPELSQTIAEAIAVAENVSQEARFIPLPVQIQN